MPTNKLRRTVAAITLTAAGFAAIINWEGWSPKAVPPVAGDAGAITASDFTLALGTPPGSAAVEGARFLAFITRTQHCSMISWQAMQ
ncbi:MAG: hypothetical protein LBF61_06020 [Azoarcus sp.]|jgi:hypothetical protein|nr:hypothetical protein [Azoarcus sp.]